MTTETTYFTSGALPDPDLSGNACAWGPAYTGLDCDPSSVCINCNPCFLKRESGRFSALEAPVYQDDYDTYKIRFSWSTTPDNDCSQAIAYAQYSTNGGSSWNNFSGWPKNPVASASGTGTVSLSVAQSHTTVRVRFYVEATCNDDCCPSPPSAVCHPALDITNLRVEGVYTTGACCNPDTGGCSVVTESNCTGSKIYQGDGTDCSPNPCPPPASPTARQVLITFF